MTYEPTNGDLMDMVATELFGKKPPRWVDRKLPDGSIVRIDTHWVCGILPQEVCEPTQDFGITEQL